MALTANTIPSQIPFPPAPYDATNAFANSQVIAATGYVNNVNQQLDLGGGNPAAAAGRTEGLWCIDLTNLKVSATDETYKLHLMGSNDQAWGNGNVELLHFHDFAALAANRQVATILGATPAVPFTNRGGSLIHLPFTNLIQGIVYRFVRMYLVVGGTAPTMTVTSWLSYADNDH